MHKVGVSKYSKYKSNCGTLIVFLRRKKLPVNIADHCVAKNSHVEICGNFCLVLFQLNMFYLVALVQGVMRVLSNTF